MCRALTKRPTSFLLHQEDWDMISIAERFGEAGSIATRTLELIRAWWKCHSLHQEACPWVVWDTFSMKPSTGPWAPPILHVLHPVLPRGWLPVHLHRWWEQTFADGLCTCAESLSNFAGLGENTKNLSSLGKTNRRLSILGLALQDWEKTCNLENSPARRKKTCREDTTLDKVWESLRVRSWTDWWRRYISPEAH